MGHGRDGIGQVGRRPRTINGKISKDCGTRAGGLVGAPDVFSMVPGGRTIPMGQMTLFKVKPLKGPYPAHQRDLIDDLARYKCPEGLISAIKGQIMTEEQVEAFRRNALRLIDLKPLPSAALRWKHERPAKKGKHTIERGSEHHRGADGRIDRFDQPPLFGE